MLAVLTAVLGFLGPFLPEVLKFLNRRQDNQHELAMYQLQMKAAEKAHALRMAELEATADIREAEMLHRPAPSFGVQMLDAARDSGLKGWAIIPTFYLFVFVDVAAALVRPALTYTAFGFYVAYKFACYSVMGSVSTADATWAQHIINLWGDQDWAVVTLVLSYWFGHRAAKAAFGGNATSGKAG